MFEGPFDLLLALISKHKLDITEVALSQVTDEFIAYISQRSDGWDLDQVSYFLVVAATLLDLKAARLLPSGEVEDEEDLALLEARDLLFARLLQYRAYKEVAAIFAAHYVITFLVQRAGIGHAIYLQPGGGVLLQLKVAMYIGVVLAGPVIIQQIWWFVSPGLHPRERRFVLPLVVATIVFFLIGVTRSLSTSTS